MQIQQVTDVLHFLTTNDDNIRYLWLSESSGYRHLEMVTVATGSNKDASGIMQHCMVERKELTKGEWVIKQDQVSISMTTLSIVVHQLLCYRFGWMRIDIWSILWLMLRLVWKLTCKYIGLSICVYLHTKKCLL